MKNRLQLSNGSIFFISNIHGETKENNEFGYFVNDTKYLSKFIIKLNNKPLIPLSEKESDNDNIILVKLNEPTESLRGKSVTVVQDISLSDQLINKFKIINNSKNEVNISLSIELKVDFADIFEVKKRRSYSNLNVKKHREIIVNKGNNYLYYSYQSQEFKRGTLIKFSEEFEIINEDEVAFKIKLNPKEEKDLSCLITALDEKLDISNYGDKSIELATEEFKSRYLLSNNNGTRLETDWFELDNLYLQSVNDLKSLTLKNYKGVTSDFEGLLAAGLPWYMTLFGRDSVITSIQSLLFNNELAKKTLLLLSRYQGRKLDKLSEEEPGKIFHEVRFGEYAFFNEWVKFPYYGSNDSTPLFLVLCGELYEVSKEKELFITLKPNILRALEWVENYGDIDKDGYIEYERKSERGIKNQNWRDSFNSMVFQNGLLAKTPIASSDVQGYLYKAKIGLSKIAMEVWGDKSLSEKFLNEAIILKDQFNKDFWINDRKFFAIGIDKDKKKIDSLTSSIGQLLWTGIVNDDKVEYIVKHLTSSNLDSGFGIRTLDEKHSNYNPLGYHIGTIWPHDNSIIFEGLMKYGFKQEAVKMIENMINCSKYFNYRLPETFSGYAKSSIKFPVEYPVAASPQAWAAGAALMFIKSMLNITLDKESETLKFDPIFPEYVDYIRLTKIKAWGKTFELKYYKGETEVNSSNY